VNAVRSNLFVAMHEGEYRAFTNDTRQDELFEDKSEIPANVTPIAQAQAK
jgi:hypothetical protein